MFQLVFLQKSYKYLFIYSFHWIHLLHIAKRTISFSFHAFFMICYLTILTDKSFPLFLLLNLNLFLTYASIFIHTKIIYCIICFFYHITSSNLIWVKLYFLFFWIVPISIWIKIPLIFFLTHRLWWNLK